MWRVLTSTTPSSSDDNHCARIRYNFLRYRPVFEAIIQSAAIYSAASLLLVITAVAHLDKEVLAGVLIVMPPIVVRPVLRSG